MVIAVLGGFSFFVRSGVPVLVAEVKQRPLRSYVDERARTRIEYQYVLTMPFPGRIGAITCQPGDLVAAGQKLAEVVDIDRKLDLAIAQAAVARWEAALAEASDRALEKQLEQLALHWVSAAEALVEATEQQQKAQARWLDYYSRFAARVAKLALTSAESETQKDLAETQRDAAALQLLQQQAWLRAQQAILAASQLLPEAVRAYTHRRQLQQSVVERQLEEARLALEQAQLRWQRAVMTSPIDGVVLARYRSNEQFVAAGTELLTIGDLNQLEVETDILSSSAVLVRPSDAVELYGPTVGRPLGQGWKGRVRRVEPQAFTKTSALGVEEQRTRIIIAFDDLAAVRREVPSLGFGFELRARIYTSPPADRLAIPRSALFRDDQGQWSVFVVERGRARARRVQLGLTNDLWAEVTEGLAPGNRVIVAPDGQIRDGTAVESVPFSSFSE